MFAWIIAMQNRITKIKKLLRDVLKEWMIEPGIAFADDHVVVGRIRFRQHILAPEQLKGICNELLSVSGRDDPQRLDPRPPLLYVALFNGLDEIGWWKRLFC